MATYYASSLAVGGGTGTEVSPWTLSELATGMAGGDTGWVKADGTYSVGTTLSFPAGGVNASTRVAGYQSVIGDGGRPTINASAGSIVILGNHPSSYIWFDGFIINGNGFSSVTALNLFTYGRASRISMIDCTGGISLGNSSVAYRCDSELSGSIRGFRATAVNCFAKDAASNGFGVETAINCIATRCVGHGFAGYSANQQQASNWINCIAYDNALSGFRGDAYAQGSVGTGSIAINNGNFGFQTNGTSGLGGSLDHCVSYNNTSGEIVSAFAVENPIEITADPFVDAANDDFNINNATGGGAVLRAVTETLIA